jgi:protein tyrosine phosphatase
VRKFALTRSDIPNSPTKHILHVHNTVWPDKGIPDNSEAFADMVEYVKQEYDRERKANTGPLVVHCYGGIGRTGSFIACFTCLSCIHEKTEVDLFKTLVSMRGERAMMIQTRVGCSIRVRHLN